MKFKLSVCLIGLFIIVSCQKEIVISKAEPVNVIPVANKSPEELLTAKTWKADEIRTQLSDGGTQYYKRGMLGNTVNYDTDSLQFNLNNTGLYFYSDLQYEVTWNFINPEKTKITLVINFSPPLTIHMENINLTENSYTYSQYITGTGSYLASCRRTPN